MSEPRGDDFDNAVRALMRACAWHAAETICMFSDADVLTHADQLEAEALNTLAERGIDVRTHIDV